MRLSNTPQETTVLRLEQRKTFSCNVLFTDGTGGRVDLTGSVLTLDRVINLDRVDRLEDLVLGDVASTTAELVDAAAGHARFTVQAAELAQRPGSYPFTITLRGPARYSVVVVKGTVELQQNGEFASAEVTATDAQPGQNLEVVLRGTNVVDVNIGSALPPGVRYLSDGDQAKLDLLQMGDDGVVVDLTDYATVTYVDDLATALRTEMPIAAATVVDELRPAAQYGTVVSTDRLNNTATVLLSGQSVHTTVQIAGVWPQASGQVVRVETFSDGLYITDTLGTPAGPTPGTLSQTANLDTFTETGLYHQGSNTWAGTGSNYPTPKAGMLEVQNLYRNPGGFIYQRYTVFGGDALDRSTVYTRGFYNDTWFPWQKNISGPDGLITGLRTQGNITLYEGHVMFASDSNKAVQLNALDGTALGRMLMTNDGRIILNADAALASSSRVTVTRDGDLTLRGSWHAMSDTSSSSGLGRQVYAGTQVVALNGSGEGTLTYPAFTSRCQTVVVCSGSAAGSMATCMIPNFSNSGFSSQVVRGYSATGALCTNTSVRVNYVITGM